MKFTFNLTEQDYLDFNMFTVKNYPFYIKRKKLFRIIFAVIPFGTALVFWLLEGAKRNRVDFIVGILVTMVPLSILFWFGFPKYFDATVLRNAKKVLSFKGGKNNILGERSLFFEEGAIRTVTEYEESLIQYRAITEIKQSEKAVYLYTAPMMALILPLRVFADEAERQLCMDFIHAKLR